MTETAGQTRWKVQGVPYIVPKLGELWSQTA